MPAPETGGAATRGLKESTPASAAPAIDVMPSMTTSFTGVKPTSSCMVTSLDRKSRSARPQNRRALAHEEPVTLRKRLLKNGLDRWRDPAQPESECDQQDAKQDGIGGDRRHQRKRTDTRPANDHQAEHDR